MKKTDNQVMTQGTLEERIERVLEIQIVKAKNEDEAFNKNKFDDWGDYEVKYKPIQRAYTRAL